MCAVRVCAVRVCVCVCMLCVFAVCTVCVPVASVCLCASSARKGFGSAPRGNLDPSLNRFTLPNPTGHAPPPLPPPSAAPAAIGCSFINRKRSLQLALNDFWLNTHALPSGSAPVSVPPRSRTEAQSALLSVTLSERNYRISCSHCRTLLPHSFWGQSTSLHIYF